MNEPKDLMLLSSMPVVDYFNDVFQSIVYGCYAFYAVIRLIKYAKSEKTKKG